MIIMKIIMFVMMRETGGQEEAASRRDESTARTCWNVALYKYVKDRSIREHISGIFRAPLVGGPLSISLCVLT